MKFKFIVLLLPLMSGCDSKLTHYNIKTSIGQTLEDGSKSVYTGISLDSHFEVK